MNLLKSDTIQLRTLEPKDIDALLKWENDTTAWNVSQTRVPFSKDLLERYISSAQDLKLHGQIRFIIMAGEEAVGAIDLFEYDPINQRVGIGIIIDKNHRKKGWAALSIEMLSTYAKEVLLCHQLYCTILENNPASIRLFESVGFSRSGEQKDWIRTAEGWQTAYFYQKIL